MFSGFRPLPGYLISQCMRSIPTSPTSLFPSPSGVSHFSMKNYIPLWFGLIAFPSPSGVSHFSITSEIRKHKRRNRFPSPSGVSHFSIEYVFFSAKCKCQCFRPLPGYLISQCMRSIPTSPTSLFPSPSGVSHFSIQGRQQGEVIRLGSSVPFRGISFLNCAIGAESVRQ